MDRWLDRIVSGFAVLILLSCSANSSYKLSRKAETFYQKKAFTQALPFFIQSIDGHGKDNTAWLLKGAEVSLKAGDVEHAYQWLDKIIKRKGYKELNAYFLMGQVLQRKHQFNDAILVYKTWLKHANRKDPKRPLVKNYIAQSDLGIWKLKEGEMALISPFDTGINTSSSQFGALPSYSTEGKIYFTSTTRVTNSSKWNARIFYTLDLQGKWSDPVMLTPSEKPTESLIDIGGLGKSLLYYSGNTWKDGNLYIRPYTSATKENTLLGVQAYGFDGRMGADIFKDSILIFASDKPGGYGGYDLYMSIFRNGTWDYPVNLGPQINSEWDEITPFLANDARTLYYSTNSALSIGGYDVVRTFLDERTLSWTKPQNIGIPINSGANDTHFRINNDGYRALVTSDRPGGRGGQDIYNVFFNTLHTDQFYSNDPFVFAILYDELKKLGTTWQETFQYLYKKKKLNLIKNKKAQKYHLVLHPIYIEADAYLSDPRVLRFLEKLATVMKKHPNLHLDVNGYLSPKIKPWQTMYYSFQKVEVVRNYLHKLGIASERITTRGFGDRFEVAQNSINDHPSEVGRRFNSRIEFTLIGKADFLKIEYEKPKVPDYLAIRYPEVYPNGIYYKIYLQSSGQMFINPLISKQNKAVIERIDGKGKVDYLIGSFTTYSAAKYGIKNLNANRFRSMKIIPYYQGRRLDRSEIMDYALKYPDLNNYLKENN